MSNKTIKIVQSKYWLEIWIHDVCVFKAHTFKETDLVELFNRLGYDVITETRTEP